MNRVVVTGLGAVTPLGVGIKTSWSRLLAGHVGVASLRSRPEFRGVPSQVAGLVPRGRAADGGWDPNEWLDKGDERRMAPFAQYAVAAAAEAIEDAGLQSLSDAEKEGVCVNIGSGIGSFEDVVDTALAYDKGGYRAVSPLFVPRLLINLAAGHVSMRHGFTGASLAPATACTTGTHAVADALRLLRNAENSPDAPSVVLAGAAEACVAPLAMAGFARARSLATPFDDYRPGAADDEGAAARAASRPFDAARTGFVLAEGAAVLVLETLAHALARGVPPSRICAELAGAGCASDAWHATAPHPGGRGARLAMERALRDARADPRDVDWVCAHATGTRAGDAAENRAVRAVMLGDGGDQGRFKDGAADVNVSSVKGALGHLLGAAGAVEAAFAALAVREDVLPPTVNLDVPGDGDGGWDMNYVARVKQHRRVDVAVSNSAGFGGTCASVVFRKFRM